MLFWQAPYLTSLPFQAYSYHIQSELNMRTKYAGDNLTFYTKLTIIAANVTALVFLITAFFLAVSFPADGFEQAASALQFAPVRIIALIMLTQRYEPRS